VSLTCQSIGGEATKTPVMPPMTNTSMNPRDISIAVENRIAPRHMVPIQLNTLTPVGTAIRNDISEKYGRYTEPVANMWWAQTPNDSAAIPKNANTIAR
jgi:hypothetical protein